MLSVEDSSLRRSRARTLATSSFRDFESSLKRELYEEVGYKGDLRYQLFDASDEMYIERIDANQICFYCRVWPENFDFIPGEEGDEMMFIDPEELLLQESEVDAPARAYKVHAKWQQLRR